MKREFPVLLIWIRRFFLFLFVSSCMITVGYPLIQRLYPISAFTSAQTFTSRSKALSPLEPPFRVSKIIHEDNLDFQKLIGEPVYFFLTVPPNVRNLYKTLRTKITFENPDHDDLRFGAQITKEFDFNTSPIHNNKLDQLHWPKLEKDGKTLFQKNPQFASIDEFLEHIPPNKKIGTYFSSLPSSADISDYHASKQTYIYQPYIRGSFTLFTYIDNEDLHIDLSWINLHWSNISNDITFSIRNNSSGDLISSETVSGTLGSNIRLSKQGLPRGVYRIDILAGDRTSNIVFSEIHTQQSKITFRGDIAFHTLDKNTIQSLTTNGTRYRVRVLHPENRQTITIDGQPYSAIKIRTNQIIDISQIKGPTHTVEYTKGDILLQTNGYISLSKESFFNPESDLIIKLESQPFLDLQQFDFVLAEYKSPTQSNGLLEAERDIDLSKTLIENDKIRFIFNAPEILELDHEIKIHRIEMTLIPKEFSIQHLKEFPIRFKQNILRI